MVGINKDIVGVVMVVLAGVNTAVELITQDKSWK